MDEQRDWYAELMVAMIGEEEFRKRLKGEIEKAEKELKVLMEQNIIAELPKPKYTSGKMYCLCNGFANGERRENDAAD